MSENKSEFYSEYCFRDPANAGKKRHAIECCEKLRQANLIGGEAVAEAAKELFGAIGKAPIISMGFSCDRGFNIRIGDYPQFNYNVTILDGAPVTIGDNCLIGPNTLITTVGHPLSPMGRRNCIGQTKPITIGNDVWIGGNCVILQGVTIGNNVVVAAGAVVTKDVPDNCVVAGVPARVIRELENDIPEEER